MNNVLSSRVLLSLAAAAALASTLASTAALATPVRLDGREANLQQIIDDLTVGGASSIDVLTDQSSPDQAWSISSPLGASGMIVMEIAGYAGRNRFGLYDLHDTGNRLELFAGGDGAGAQFIIDAAGQVYRNSVNTGLTFTSPLFGFYLQSPDGLWFSQPGLNTDGADHMLAYRGQGDSIHSPLNGNIYTWSPDLFLLAWEDLATRHWDQDYNDFTVLIGGVQSVPVPEPASIGLLGLGLAAIGLAGRRRKRKRPSQ